jgi:prepilin-type N-terminal cleavage/methylation domain-containing protein
MLARQQGFSLLETLLAMAIGSVILLAAALSSRVTVCCAATDSSSDA